MSFLRPKTPQIPTIIQQVAPAAPDAPVDTDESNAVVDADALASARRSAQDRRNNKSSLTISRDRAFTESLKRKKSAALGNISGATPVSSAGISINRS